MELLAAASLMIDKTSPDQKQVVEKWHPTGPLTPKTIH